MDEFLEILPEKLRGFSLAELHRIEEQIVFQIRQRDRADRLLAARTGRIEAIENPRTPWAVSGFGGNDV